MMKRLIENTKYIAFLAVVSLLVASLATFVAGLLNTYKVVTQIISSFGQDETISYNLIKLVDVFLIAIVLYLLGVSIYKIFIGDLDLPDWMIAHNLHELKAKLSSVIILVGAVIFLEDLIKMNGTALDLLWIALAVTAVGGMLIAFSVLGEKD
jgi:uncharacterized membrane protein YqhA